MNGKTKKDSLCSLIVHQTGIEQFYRVVRLAFSYCECVSYKTHIEVGVNAAMAAEDLVPGVRVASSQNVMHLPWLGYRVAAS